MYGLKPALSIASPSLDDFVQAVKFCLIHARRAATGPGKSALWQFGGTPLGRPEEQPQILHCVQDDSPEVSELADESG
jgi:hypothetical protein